MPDRHPGLPEDETDFVIFDEAKLMFPCLIGIQCLRKPWCWAVSNIHGSQ